MNLIFIDTSALVAIGDKRDNFHKKAISLYKNLRRENRRFITNSAVITELANYFSEPVYKNIAIHLVDEIHQSSMWVNEYVYPKLHDTGYELYKKMEDKGWSLTDSISISLAREKKITEIFTNDHHFEQAGFNILLK